MWRWIVGGVGALALLVFGFSLVEIRGDGGEINASAAFANPEPDIAGFTRAIEPWDWQFPADHGPHPDFQTEWWYYTGNLETETGRHFGYQFTIFRRALTPGETEGGSEWRTNQLYLAHFTVSDIEGDQFYDSERFSRGGAGLAGAETDPAYRVWLEGWQVLATNPDATELTITADAGTFAVDFTLDQSKPPAFHGINGLSAKGDQPGNASYYYSLPRLATRGTIRIADESFEVNGATWMDHEFSTSALTGGMAGWDWFGLQLDDGRELVIGQIRLLTGGTGMVSGLLVQPDGSTIALEKEDVQITATGTWRSPHSNAEYPAGWEIVVTPNGADPLRLTVTPLMADQELLTQPTYWEGAVELSGDAGGFGYAELVGYVSAMQARF